MHWVGPVDVSPHPGQPSHLLFGQSFLGGEPGSVPVGDAHAGVDVLMGVMLHILVDCIQPGVPLGFLVGQGPDEDHSWCWIAPQRCQKFSGSFHVPLSCASVFSSLPDRGLSPVWEVAVFASDHSPSPAFGAEASVEAPLQFLGV